MNNVYFHFVTGFMTAGIIGLLASLILRSWQVIEFTRREMFVLPPRPILREISGSANEGNSGISALPRVGPMLVLTRGCFTIFFQTFIFLGLFIVLGGIIYGIFSSVEISSATMTGILYAAIYGLILHNLRINRDIISVLYRQIFDPPRPSLNHREPPNESVVGARPVRPPCGLVFNNSTEIILRIIWTIVLFFILVYVSIPLTEILLQNEPDISPTRVFEVLANN